MKWIIHRSLAASVAMLATSVYAQQTPCTGDLGCWRHNSDTLAQSAAIKQNADGSVAIGIAITGGSAGTAPQRGSPAARVIEAPRGGSSQGGADLSWWRSSVQVTPSNGGANLIVPGPISQETFSDGTNTQLGGFAIGGWTLDTPGTSGRTTTFAPVGPVPHIDPWALAISAEHEAPPPPVSLKSNPDPGVVAIPSWFWVAGYDGAPITHSKTQHASHTECRLLAGVPNCRTVDDSVTVNVRLTPTRYTWNFGDGRTGSVQSYTPDKGLGRAYTDATTASPVQWSYEFDSRDFASGFPIKLTITFAGAFQANGGSWQSLPAIEDNWTTGLVMRQVQTLITAPNQSSSKR